MEETRLLPEWLPLFSTIAEAAQLSAARQGLQHLLLTMETA